MSRRRNSLKRAALSFLCIVLAVILTAMLSVTLYFQYLLRQINYVEHDDTPTLSQEQLNEYLAQEEDADPNAPSMDAGDVEFEEHTTQIGGKGSGLVNILLIGQDRRPGESRARSDTMILCTFNKHTKTLTMTSFLRDLYVPIPGHRSDRINAAYAYGGSALLKQTLTENFEVPIAGVIEVDFSQFSQLIDILGGVEIELRKDEAALVNKETGSNLSEGRQLLTGVQALSYSRIRKLDSDGDFSRTDRQRKVMTALVDGYRNTGLGTLMKLLKQVLPMLSTDMSESRLLLLALEVFPMLPELSMSSQSIPAPGTYTDKTIDGMDVLVADMDAARKLLQETAQ